MIRTISSLAMAAVLFIHPVASFAEFSVVTSADVAYKTGKFALPGKDDSKPLKPIFKTLNVTLAAAYGNAYLAAAYESPFSDHQELVFDSGFVFDDRFTRSDANLTVGYRVWPWMNVFGGYLHGKSELQRVQYLPSLVLDEFFIFRYNETGPFAGLSLSHSFSRHGTLSFSVAYAKLDGKITYIRNGFGLNFPTADTSGFSYSLLWIGQLDSTLSYRVGVKATRYELDFSKFSATFASVKESYSSIFLGITKAF